MRQKLYSKVGERGPTRKVAFGDTPQELNLADIQEKCR